MRLLIVKIFLAIFIILIVRYVSADELIIPFSCWPKQLSEEFQKAGLKLDLESSERTKESWGYVINKGSEYVLFTYKLIKKEEFELIQNIVFKIEKEQS